MQIYVTVRSVYLARMEPNNGESRIKKYQKSAIPDARPKTFSRVINPNTFCFLGHSYIFNAMSTGETELRCNNLACRAIVAQQGKAVVTTCSRELG